MSGYIKKALWRAEGAPVGVTTPMNLQCTCGRLLVIDVVRRADTTCGTCGSTWDARGWLLSTPGVRA